MLHKFIDSIRHIKPSSSFDNYLMNIQRSGQSGNATANEAKKDYRSAMRIRDRYYLG